MGSENAVILIEGNEHTPRFLSPFMEAGRLPNFARFLTEAHAFRTTTDEAVLNPWVQWVTVHTGVPLDVHGITKLGDGARYPGARIWDCVSTAGRRSVVLGSMNVRYQEPMRGCIVPDSWDDVTQPHPSTLRGYSAFVNAAIQGHLVDGSRPGARDVARFAAFMLSHGLSWRTVRTILSQLVSERGDTTRRWRRVAALDRLQWDLFRHLFRATRPCFATFFSNSVAHLQHRYWRHFDPTPFPMQPSADERARYEAAIPYGYDAFDALLGELLDLASSEITLVYCSALSQQPCTLHDAAGGKHVYRPRRFEDLLRWAGVEAGARVAPVMAEEMNVYFDREEAAQRAAENLGRLTCYGKPLIKVTAPEPRRLFVACRVHELVPEDATFEAGGRRFRFYDHFTRLGVEKSAMHHPEGILWIRLPTRQHRVHEAPVPLTSIAPTILHLLGIERSLEMRGPILL